MNTGQGKAVDLQDSLSNQPLHSDERARYESIRQELENEFPLSEGEPRLRIEESAFEETSRELAETLKPETLAKKNLLLFGIILFFLSNLAIGLGLLLNLQLALRIGFYLLVVWSIFLGVYLINEHVIPRFRRR